MRTALADRRTWTGGGVLLAVLVVAAAWLLAIGPELASARDSRSQAAAVTDQNLVLQHKVAALKKQADAAAALRGQLDAALAKLPSDSGLPAFTRQLTGQAAQAGVTLTGVSIGGVVPAGRTGAGVFAIPVSTQTTGSVGAQTAFVGLVRTSGPRGALVNSIQFTPSGATSGNDTAMTMELTVFSAPLSADQLAAIQQLAVPSGA